LGGKQLAALQLRARGYTHEQIGHLLGGGSASAAVAVLESAAQALDARDTPDATQIARQRGLIV
jgi:hypothetical protein